MNTSRRWTVAAALGSVVLCVVAACSSGGGPTGQGTLGNLTAPSNSPSVGASAPVTGKPTVTPSSHKSSPPTTSGTPMSAPPSSPGSSPPSNPGGTVTFHILSDWYITTTHTCYWSINYNAGEDDLQVAVEFTIGYNGLLVPGTVPFTMTASPSDGYHTTGDEPAGTAVLRTGGKNYKTSPYAGQQVTVTGSLTATDDDLSDNSVSTTVSMPTVQQIDASGFQDGHIYPATCS